MADPTPVPSVSSNALPMNPRPAPNFISACAAAAASLINATRQPVAALNTFVASRPMNLEWRFAEVRIRGPWMTPGNPTPMGPRHLK